MPGQPLVLCVIGFTSHCGLLCSLLWLRADQEWLVRVFLIPLLLVGVAALRFAYVRHTRPEAAEDAAGNFHSHVFGIVFIVYRAFTDTAQPCLASV